MQEEDGPAGGREPKQGRDAPPLRAAWDLRVIEAALAAQDERMPDAAADDERGRPL